MDETNGRIEASRRGHQVIGTLGILVESHHAGLLDLSDAIEALKATSFRASPAIYELILKSV